MLPPEQAAERHQADAERAERELGHVRFAQVAERDRVGRPEPDTDRDQSAGEADHAAGEVHTQQLVGDVAFALVLDDPEVDRPDQQDEPEQGQQSAGDGQQTNRELEGDQAFVVDRADHVVEVQRGADEIQAGDEGDQATDEPLGRLTHDLISWEGGRIPQCPEARPKLSLEFDEQFVRPICFEIGRTNCERSCPKT